MQRSLRKAMGQALRRYDMIADHDRILVGLSGGKDSWTMLDLLNQNRRRAPIDYTLFPVYVDPGFADGFGPQLQAQGQSRGFDIRIELTDCGVVAHSRENRENPCFLCARLRRRRLFEVAAELGCSKIALGHNRDDLIETLFLNMFYAGEISTMKPKQAFFDGRYHIIRPLAFAHEDEIQRFVRVSGAEIFENPCPSSGRSKRYEIKQMLQSLYRSNRKIKGNIFRAMQHVRPEYLL